MGRSPQEAIDIPLVITKMEPIRAGDNKRRIAVHGMMSVLPYMIPTRQFISDRKSGVEAALEKASQYFETTLSNITKSADSQYWVQPNTTDRDFINDCWMHSDIADSFIACGISTDRRFIMKDMRKALGQTFDWRFISSPVEDNDIPYDGDFQIQLNTGFTNSWVGYKRPKVVYNQETGISETITEEIKPLMALTQEVSRRGDVDSRQARPGIVNENVHPNYHRAHLRNLQYNAMFGSVNLTLSFSSRYVPIRVLDLVMFKEDSIMNPKRESNQYLSGLYFVHKVVRVVQNRQFATVVELGRESLNEQRGNFALTSSTTGISETEAAAAVAAANVPTQTDVLREELTELFPGRFP